MASDPNNQDPARALRPLLSAPSETHRTPLELSNLRQLSNLRPKNKSVRAACETCRKKKSKCTGERPQCQPCAVRGSDCRYETIATETHSQARKRKYDDLQSQATIFQELYQLLRTVSDDQSREVVSRVRAGAEPESVVRFLKNGDLPVQLHVAPETVLCYEFPYNSSMPSYLLSPDNAYLRSPIYDASLSGGGSTPSAGSPSAVADNALYLKPYHLAQIADERFENVSASKWTSVISDNTLLARLLNAYFMHAYPAFPAFQKDLFLDDLVTGQTQFCSKLLVNAVLAHACHCYKPLTNRSNHWTSQSLAYRFVMEAKRLWDIEDLAAPKLTTVQAAIVLNVIYNSNGTDRIGTTLLQRAISMANELQLLTNPSLSKNEKMAQARQFTAWCLYVWQVMHGYYFFKAPLIDRPPDFTLPDPDIHKDWYGEIWLRYPSSGGLSRLNFPHVFRAWASLRVLINGISVELFGDYRPPEQPLGSMSWTHVFMFQSSLEAWYRSLPDPLRPENIALPFQIRLHMEYYSTLYTLFQTQQKTQPPPPPTPPPNTSAALSVQSLCSPIPDPEPLMESTGPRFSAPSHSYAGGGHNPASSGGGPPMARSESMPTMDRFMAQRTPLPAGHSSPNEYIIPPGPPLTLRLPPPQTSATQGAGTGSAGPPFSQTSPNYNARPGVVSTGHSLPHRYPTTPGSARTPGSVLGYGATSPGAPAAGHVPPSAGTGQAYGTEPSVSAPGPLPTPRPSAGISRPSPTAPAHGRIASSPLQYVGEAMSQFIKHCETLVRLYYLRHSFEHYDSFLIYFLTLLGTAAIERAGETRDSVTLESLRSTIGLCVKGIYNQGQNFYLATIVARVLKSRVPAEDLQLLLRSGDLSEVDEDTEDIQADNIRAEWPIPIITINEDRRTSMIDTLVHTVEGFILSTEDE